MRNTSSNSHESYYCYACFHTFRTQSKLYEHSKLCKDHNYCEIRLPKDGKNTISHKFGSKALKINDMLILDPDYILEKHNKNENNENIPLTILKDKHTVCGYSITHLQNPTKKCTTNGYHGQDSLDKVCDNLLKHS